MLTTGAHPDILIRANICNNDPIRYIVLVVSCFVLPIPNIYRDTSVLIPSLNAFCVCICGAFGPDGTVKNMISDCDACCDVRIIEILAVRKNL